MVASGRPYGSHSFFMTNVKAYARRRQAAARGPYGERTATVHLRHGYGVANFYGDRRTEIKTVITPR